ncbi:hypothetical protein [Providencia manganoxydans]|uniref:hypothetical protein n=1 Tax=Providencia manganoxydans TaxID=2923283 RepID=UPI0032DAA541
METQLKENKLDLRDYFAAKAMQGDWAAQQEENGFFCHECTDETLEKFAAFYYRMADAMLKARG